MEINIFRQNLSNKKSGSDKINSSNDKIIMSQNVMQLIYKYAVLLILTVGSSCSSNDSENQNFNFSDYILDHKADIKKILEESWGADTAFVEFLGVVPDSLYKAFRSKYDRDYPNGTYITVEKGESENVSMDEYFEMFPQSAPIFRVYMTRRDKETMKGVKTVDLGETRGVKAYIGNVDYIVRNYYVLTAMIMDGDFYTFSSDSRFFNEYEEFAKIMKPYTEISESTLFACFIRGNDEVKVDAIGDKLKWLDNFTEYYHLRSSVQNQPKCGCNDGLTEVVDIDGNHYRIIQIGDNCWMKDNLRVTKFSNNDTIQHLSNSVAIEELMNIQVSPLYAEYAFDKSNIEKYGYLYNRKVIMDNRNVCPIGWHVPNDSDYYSMVKLYDSEFDPNLAASPAGDALMEGSNIHWSYDNSTPATNNSGLSAVGGGMYQNNSFDLLKSHGVYWLYNPIKEFENERVAHIHLNSLNKFVEHVTFTYGDEMYSIRCVKDK